MTMKARASMGWNHESDAWVNYRVVIKSRDDGIESEMKGYSGGITRKTRYITRCLLLNRDNHHALRVVCVRSPSFTELDASCGISVLLI